jgi:hypothetical protein
MALGQRRTIDKPNTGYAKHSKVIMRVLVKIHRKYGMNTSFGSARK